MNVKEMTPQNAKTRQTIAPQVDVLENEQEYLVLADLPGASPDQVQIELHDGELTLRAPKAQQDGKDLMSGGRASYEYARRFRVPSGVQADKIEAKLNLGVLELHIPKEEAKKPRQIQVRA